VVKFLSQSQTREINADYPEKQINSKILMNKKSETISWFSLTNFFAGLIIKKLP